MWVSVCVCVSVCVRALVYAHVREREQERERAKECQNDMWKWVVGAAAANQEILIENSF